MKTILALLIMLLVAGATLPAKTWAEDNDLLYQVSTINALLIGVYDGDTSFGELKKHGDFGLGTLDGLDGEMVGLDGEFFQVTVDGTVHTVGDSAQTPFSIVTRFIPDRIVLLGKAATYDDLRKSLDTFLPSENIFYAIRIEGTFSFIKTRSVPAQQKPYPPLTTVVSQQKVFEFRDIEGTLVGFRAPFFIRGINVPGYHMHFISKDRKSGGHLLECSMEEVEVAIDDIHSLSMSLPHTPDFSHANLGKDKSEELNTVEKSTASDMNHVSTHKCTGCSRNCGEHSQEGQ